MMAEPERTTFPVESAFDGALVGAKHAPREPASRAALLDAIAAALDRQRDAIIAVTSEETALTPDELAPEFARMTGTLRMFADLVREGSWVRAAIDPASPGGEGVIGPNHDVRRMLMPLDGVVAVFGASNFPLAYGVCGGDTASALAAGCAVVVKEHPAHPRTGRLIARTAQQAIADAGASPGLLGYVEHTDPRDHSVAGAILRHPALAAVGFTGSVGGGRAIDRLARERDHPVPVFAEMGSVNAVVVSAAAAERRAEETANLLADSILARVGQQCTRPGLILAPDDADAFVHALAARIAAAPVRDMLAPWIHESYLRRLEEVSQTPGVQRLTPQRDAPGPRAAPPALFKVNQRSFIEHPALREEIFGPAAIVVGVARDMNLSDIPLPRALVCSVLDDSTDERGGAGVTWSRLALQHLSGLAGRVAFNTPPTGVRVAHGMSHGGPWPATNRPDTTAVGPYAIERWCRPVCFQNCPDSLLPPELQDANPRGILRLIRGIPTRDPVIRGGSRTA